MVAVQPAVPAEVLGYAEQLAGQLAAASEDLLRGAYLHGSAVLGGWIPERSDVDILFVTADGTADAVLETMARTLQRGAADSPGSALECSVVTVTHAGRPAPPWPFLLHVAGRKPVRVVANLGGPPSGDADLLMHYAVCRAAGLAVYGPPAPDIVGAVPRRIILDYLAGELRWAIEQASEAYAVLNACRARVFRIDNRIVSKVAGGEIALARGQGPTDVIRRALSQQRGAEEPRSSAPDATDFVLSIAAELRS